MGFLDHYRQFRALPPEEVSRRLREDADRRRAGQIERVPALDLTDTTWHEPPHPEVVNAATYALRRAVHRYADLSAQPVREAAAARHGVAPDEVVAGHGAGELLLAALHRLAPGHDVVMPWPAWPLLPTLVRRAGGAPRSVALAPDGTVDGDALVAAVDEHTAAVVVCSPNDPTGMRADLGRLRDRLPCHVWLIVDEALAEWPGEDAAIAVRERELRVRSFAKAHAMAGFRAGYAVGPAAFVADLAPAQGVGAPAQAAMSWALTEGDAALARRRAKAEAERRRLAAGLRGTALSAAPSETNFVWLASSRHTAGDLHAALARKQVLVAPGSVWGDDRHVRVTVRDEPATLRVIAALQELA